MSSKTKALEQEIRKIEKQAATLKKTKPRSKREGKIQEAQLSLFTDVLDDLRKQQKKLTQPEEATQARQK